MLCVIASMRMFFTAFIFSFSLAQLPAFGQSDLRLDQNEVVEDAEVDTTSGAQLDDHFQRRILGQANGDERILMPFYAATFGGATALVLLQKSHRSIVEKYTRLTSRGLLVAGDDVRLFQSKLRRNSGYVSLTLLGMAYIFIDVSAGAYVITEGYRPKFLGNVPSLLSYLHRRQISQSSGQVASSMTTISESERDGIQSDYDFLKDSVQRELDMAKKQ